MSCFIPILTSDIPIKELRVTSYYPYELRVTVYCTSYELLFICELRVTVYCTSCKLTMNYDKYKDDNDVMILML